MSSSLSNLGSDFVLNASSLLLAGLLSSSSSSGGTRGPPSATVYLFRGVGLTLEGRFAGARGGGSVVIVDGRPIPSPTELALEDVVAGKPAIDTGLFLVAELIEDGGELAGENVPPPDADGRNALSGGVA